MNTRTRCTFLLGCALAASLPACSDSGSRQGDHAKDKPDAADGTGGGSGSPAGGSGGATMTSSGGSRAVEDAATSTGGESLEGGAKPPNDTPPSSGQVNAVFPKADVLPKLTN